MFLVGSAILMCRHAITMYLSIIMMRLSAIVIYGIESILFSHAILPVGSAIIGDWLQLFLAGLTLLLYLTTLFYISVEIKVLPDCLIDLLQIQESPPF
jgi:hypothetical protein